MHSGRVSCRYRGADVDDVGMAGKPPSPPIPSARAPRSKQMVGEGDESAALPGAKERMQLQTEVARTAARVFGFFGYMADSRSSFTEISRAYSQQTAENPMLHPLSDCFDPFSQGIRQ